MFHDVNQDGVPIGCIYDDASLAAREYLVAHPDEMGAYQQRLQELADREADTVPV